MTTAQGLRKIAAREWAAGHIVTVQGLQIGIRFKRPYLKTSLQQWLDSEPESELANKLYIIGMNSLDPVKGHGYVELDSSSVTTWRNFFEDQTRMTSVFSPELREEIRKWLRRECEMRINDLIQDLENVLVDARHAGATASDLALLGTAQAAFGLCLEELGGAEAFGRWVRAFLSCRSERPALMPSYI